MDAPLLSIVVCTRNRAALLSDLLQTFVSQKGSTPYELIVVDNSSTDPTRKTVSDYFAALPNLRYVCEDTVGLSHARNRGWKEASGQYVGFVDDDCRLPNGWIAVAQEIAVTSRPHAFGGPYYPVYGTRPPAWFRDRYARYWIGDQPRPLKPNEFLSGGNLFVRRELLSFLGGFPPGFGMSGRRISYGEEVHLIRRLRAENPEASIFYDPRLFLHHFVRPEKTSLLSLARRYLQSCRDYRRITQVQEHSGPVRLRTFLWHLYRSLFHVTVGLLFRDRSSYPFFENYIVEVCLPCLSDLGADFERLLTRSSRQDALRDTRESAGM
jgi:glycosyltransferase involved in cell wall biosynthesis